MNLILILCLISLFTTAPNVIAAQTPSRPPNIVYILADDLGWTDLGCQGSRFYETPNIDSLAREGLTLTSFYVYQNCAPTRAALMSGQYSPRTGIYTVNSLRRGEEQDRSMIPPDNETNLPLNIDTIGNALQQAGYVTGLFGKWHLGRSGEYHPSQRGFTEAIIRGGRGHLQFTTLPPTDVPEGRYLADYLTDLSVDFIQRFHDRPFFLYLPHFAVHSPYQAKAKLEARYANKPAVDRHDNPVYAAMIQSVDESVGRLVQVLAAQGLTDNTVVIFSSDNGGVGGYYSSEPPSNKRGITDNAPLKGGKGTLYEGGIRVPFIVKWPGTIRAGARCSLPAAHVDLFPTFCDLASADVPEGQALDGISLKPWLLNPDQAPADRALFWHFPGYLESYVRNPGWRTTPVSVIRRGNLKLMEFFENGDLELYDVVADIGEQHNLAGSQPDTVYELHQELRRWRKSLHATLPRPKPDR